MTDEPALLQAVRATVSTIERRARIYRLAACCAGTALVVPVLMALVLMSWHPLPYLALLVAVAGVFLVIDNWTVSRWQRRVLHLWLSDGRVLPGLRDAVLPMRHLPAATVAGMLDRLPGPKPPGVPGPLHTADRASVANTCLEGVRREDRRTLLSTMGAALLASALAAAHSFPTIVPLIVALAGLLLIVLTRRPGRS